MEIIKSLWEKTEDGFPKCPKCHSEVIGVAGMKGVETPFCPYCGEKLQEREDFDVNSIEIHTFLNGRSDVIAWRVITTEDIKRLLSEKGIDDTDKNVSKVLKEGGSSLTNILSERDDDWFLLNSVIDSTFRKKKGEGVAS